MKRLFAIFAVLAAFTTSVHADNDVDTPITFDQLPVTAQQFIKKNFPDAQVVFAKKEQEFLWGGKTDTTYDVMFQNGAKLEFYENGDWKEIDCKYLAVPAGIVPEQILTVANGYHPGLPVVQIERDVREYEVKLINGVELTFDMRFNLTDYDN